MRLVTLALNLLIFCICLQASAQEQKPITVRGRLVNIMGVGGESTGWAVELDSAISVDGKQVDTIELDGLTKKAQKLQDKHVEVVGKLSHRHGVERVLQLISITRFQPVEFLLPFCS